MRSPIARIWWMLAVNRPKKIPEYRSSTRSATPTAAGGRQPMSQKAPRIARSRGWFHNVQPSGVGTPGRASAVLTVVHRVVGPLSWWSGSVMPGSGSRRCALEDFDPAGVAVDEQEVAGPQHGGTGPAVDHAG